MKAYGATYIRLLVHRVTGNALWHANAQMLNKVGCYINPSDPGLRLSFLDETQRNQVAIGNINDVSHLKVEGKASCKVIEPSLIADEHVEERDIWDRLQFSIDVSADPTGFSGVYQRNTANGDPWMALTFSVSFISDTECVFNGHDHNFLNGRNTSWTAVSVKAEPEWLTDCTIEPFPTWKSYWENILRLHTMRETKVNWSKLQQDAFDGLQCNVNMLENCKDLVELAKGLAHPMKGLSKLAQSIIKRPQKFFSEVWMRWRYEQTTTLLDFQEILDFIDRNHIDYASLLDAANTMHTVRSGERIGDTTYHFSCRLGQKNYNSYYYSAGILAQHCNNFTINLRRYGLYPTSANLWDMVPLSFVVDWFVPIGDFLSQQEESTWWNLYYTITDICYSSKTIFDYNGVNISMYRRWSSPSLPPFEYYSDNPDAGTVVKRVIDGVSMMIG